MRTKWMVGLLALGVGVEALCESHVRIVRLDFLARGVEVSHAGEAAGSPVRWESALLNAPVVEAEAVRTDGGGEAEVQLECGSALRLAPNSEFSFPKLNLRDDGVRTTRVAVEQGTAFFTLRSADSADFQVEVGGGTVEVPGGKASLRVDAAAAAAPATVAVLEGSAAVRMNNRTYVLKKKTKLEMDGAEPRIMARTEKPDAWERWSRSRDQWFERILDGASAINAAGELTAPAPPTEGVGAPTTPLQIPLREPDIAGLPPASLLAYTNGALSPTGTFFDPGPSPHGVPYCASH